MDDEAKQYLDLFKYIGFIWTVCINIIVLFVILAVFGVANTKFEKIVVAILVLLYLQTNTFSTIYARTTVTLGILMEERFNQIRTLLKDDKILPDTQETQRQLNASKTKFYINMSFVTLFYVIALFNILANL